MPFSIEKRPGGLFISFSGDLTLAEVQNWRAESAKFVLSYSEPFGVIIDMRGLRPLGTDVQTAFLEAQRYYCEHGMVRSAVIAPDRLVMMQFRRVAFDTGISAHERYFDGSKAGWGGQAVAWVRNAVEPPT